MKWIFSLLIIATVFNFPGLKAQKLPDSDFMHGMAYFSMNKPDSALFYFKKFQDSNQNKEYLNESYFNSGIIYLEQNNVSKAIELLNKAENNRKGMASFYLAKAYARNNDLENCLNYLDTHLKSVYKVPESKILLDPDFSKFETNKTWINFWNEGHYYTNFDELIADINYEISNENYIEALSVVNKGLKQKYRRSILLDKRAEIYVLLKSEKLALEDLNEAYSSDKRNPNILKRKCQLNLDLEKYSQALEDINSAIRIDATDFDLYILRAKALQKNGLIDEAENDMDYYLSFFPDDDYALYQFAKIYMDDHQYLNALKYLNKSLKLDKSKPEYFLARGESFYHTRTNEYADKDFAMALDLDPTNPDSYYLKGLVNIKLGNHDHACYCFRKAFELGKKEAYDELGKYCPEFFK